MIQNLQHVFIVPNLRRARRIITVGVLLGNLFKHLHKVHVHAGCLFDEILELLEDWYQVFGVVVGVLAYATDVFAVHAVVGRKPGTGSEGVSGDGYVGDS